MYERWLNLSLELCQKSDKYKQRQSVHSKLQLNHYFWSVIPVVYLRTK